MLVHARGSCRPLPMWGSEGIREGSERAGRVLSWKTPLGILGAQSENTTMIRVSRPPDAKMGSLEWSTRERQESRTVPITMLPAKYLI
jgi:hypothetical protein